MFSCVTEPMKVPTPPQIQLMDIPRSLPARVPDTPGHQSAHQPRTPRSKKSEPHFYPVLKDTGRPHDPQVSEGILLCFGLIQIKPLLCKSEICFDFYYDSITQKRNDQCLPLLERFDVGYFSYNNHWNWVFNVDQCGFRSEFSLCFE